MKNLLITLIAVTLFASCSKYETISPIDNNTGYQVELIQGSHVLVSTTDTTFFILAPNGNHHVRGTKLRISNMSSAPVKVRVQKTGHDTRDHIIEPEKTKGYGVK